MIIIIIFINWLYNSNSNSISMTLENLITPSSVAVFGASNREGNVGNAVITNIILGKFTGKVFPINPSSDNILGLKCYKSIFDIKCQIDLAVIVTPSNTILQIIEDCGNKGVKAAVIISAGFRDWKRRQTA
jgi:acyl-CoA synthetase (NDP forming)